MESSRSLRAGALERWARMEVEDEPQAHFDSGHHLGRDSSSAPGEVVLIEGDELGDVRDRVLREAGTLGGKQHVPRSVEETHVRGENHPDHGAKPTPVEGVGLHDEDGAAKSRLGPLRIIEVRPPDFAALDYQSCALRLRAWAVLTAGSRALDSWA